MEIQPIILYGFVSTAPAKLRQKALSNALTVMSEIRPEGTISVIRAMLDTITIMTILAFLPKIEMLLVFELLGLGSLAASPCSQVSKE